MGNQQPSIQEIREPLLSALTYLLDINRGDKSLPRAIRYLRVMIKALSSKFLTADILNKQQKLIPDLVYLIGNTKLFCGSLSYSNTPTPNQQKCDAALNDVNNASQLMQCFVENLQNNEKDKEIKRLKNENQMLIRNNQPPINPNGPPPSAPPLINYK